MADEGWTPDMLKEHFDAILADARRHEDQRFNDLEHSIERRFGAVQEAVNKAQEAAERRFEGVNEFRQSLSDQTSSFVTRKEMEATMTGLNDRIARNTASLDKIEGRGLGLAQVGAIIAAIVMALIALGALIVLLAN